MYASDTFYLSNSRMMKKVLHSRLDTNSTKAFASSFLSCTWRRLLPRWLATPFRRLSHSSRLLSVCIQGHKGKVKVLFAWLASDGFAFVHVVVWWEGFTGPGEQRWAEGFHLGSEDPLAWGAPDRTEQLAIMCYCFQVVQRCT